MYNTLKLLRFQFSVFLLPVSLFSFYYIQPGLTLNSLLVIGIWHLLIFPASNGYNSYNDRDTGPIGGLAAPPLPTRQLLHVVNVFDTLAILLSAFVNIAFIVFVTLYIIASRLYSKRDIRLKQYPIIGFLIVFIFQGAWVFCANVFALSSPALFDNTSVLCSALATSFFIGTIYPITQIYQHESDRKDGVYTLSMMLGKRLTFIFSAVMFALANLFIYFSFDTPRLFPNFWLFNLIMLPATLFYVSWTIRSFKSKRHFNFKNTMIMLVLASVSNNIYFILLLLK
jgi:1,4-dihydroxy-2-naphthoate octaprenyltransferase